MCNGRMGRTKKVLIVDDDMQMRMMLKTAFEAEGYEVGLASNGKEGVAVLSNGRFDCLLTDVMMPIMDGLEVVRAVRAMDGEMRDVDIVLMSSLNQEGLVAEAEKLGVKGYIDKGDMMPLDIVAKVGELVG